MNGVKEKAFYSKIKNFASTDAFCFIVPFAVLFVWLGALVLGDKIEKSSGYYLLYYLYTFDKGFITRGGITGEVISWFFDEVTPELTARISAFLSAFLAFAASLCIGLALKKTKNNPETKSSVLFFIIILCVLPFSFRTFFVDQKFDKLLWALALLCVVFCKHRASIIIVPAVCVLATLINSVFLFTSMFLVSLVLLQKFYDSGYSKLNLAVCAAAYSGMIATALIALSLQKNIQFDSAAEMVDYFFSRYTGELLPADRQKIISTCVNDYFEPFKTYFIKAVKVYGFERGNWKPSLLHIVFIGLPCFACFTVLWAKAIKSAKNKFQKFIFSLCMAFPLIVIPLTVFTWEASRYCANAALVQLCLLVFYLVNSNSAVVGALKDISAKARQNYMVSACAAVYFAIFLYGV